MSNNALKEYEFNKRRRAILLLAVLFLGWASAISPTWTQTPAESRDPKLIALEKFLLAQFNPDVGLVRESPDLSINQTYWLIGDNLLAYHALKDRHPETANKIYQSMQRYGYLQDGLHEALFGNEIPLPPYTPQVKVIEEISTYTIKTEIRNSSSEAKLMDDWTEYADLLLYAALGFYNQPAHVKQTDKALYYFNRAKQMWNEAGLYDKPTRNDGYYTTHKLALLLFASNVLDQPLPFRSTLEDRIWRMQREDGGIRSHYLGDLTSDREANTETASLVLIAYNYEETKLAAERAAEVATKIQAERERQFRFQMTTFAAVSAATLITILVLQRKGKLKITPHRRKKWKTVVGVAGLILYLFGFKYAVEFLLSLPRLPWSWAHELIAPFGVGDPTRLRITKNPFFEILSLLAYPLGIVLIADYMREANIRKAWISLTILLMIILTLSVTFFLAWCYSLATEFG